MKKRLKELNWTAIVVMAYLWVIVGFILVMGFSPNDLTMGAIGYVVLSGTTLLTVVLGTMGDAKAYSARRAAETAAK